jgi:hypothetical protein
MVAAVKQVVLVGICPTDTVDPVIIDDYVTGRAAQGPATQGRHLIDARVAQRFHQVRSRLRIQLMHIATTKNGSNADHKHSPVDVPPILPAELSHHYVANYDTMKYICFKSILISSRTTIGFWENALRNVLPRSLLIRRMDRAGSGHRRDIATEIADAGCRFRDAVQSSRLNIGDDA